MNRQIVIRDAQLEDRSVLQDVQLRASLIWEEYREAILANPQCVEIYVDAFSRNEIRVAESNGVIVGFCHAIKKNGWVEIDGLFVEPSCMKMGVGRMLLEDCKKCSQAGWTLEVDANPNAYLFYEKQGFRSIGVSATQFGPGARMRYCPTE